MCHPLTGALDLALAGGRRALMVAVVLAGAGAQAGAFDMPQWQSGIAGNDPLVGKVLDASGAQTSPSAVVEAMAGADFVILGEIHDNADHHLLQAAIIEELAQTGTRPAIVLEMVPRSMQGRIDAFLAGAAPDPAQFGAAVDWEARGWPQWKTYQPIVEVALRYDLPLHAGNLARARARAISRAGIDALGDGERRDFAMDRRLTPAAEAALEQALFEGHCRLLPKEALAPMALVQTARDGAMARSMVEAAQAGGRPVVLIAGAGHARRDFGVPAALADMAPDAKVYSLSLAETGIDAAHPPGDTAVFDALLVTPRAERADPCEGLADRFNQAPAQSAPSDG